MKLLNILATSMLFLQTPALVAGEQPEDRQHFQRPDEEDVPEIDITSHPTDAPSEIPTTFPTPAPSTIPSGMYKMPSKNYPERTRSDFNTACFPANPSQSPSATPSSSPSAKPSSTPTNAPSSSPSIAPSNEPSISHSFGPSISPSSHPSLIPSGKK